MIGRPTVMTPKTLSKLRVAFLMGFTDLEACLYANIGKQTLYDYQVTNPDYSDQKEQYKLNPILKAKKTLYKALNKGDLKTSLWYLERKVKDEYSIRNETVSKNVDIENVLDSLETDYGELAKEVNNNLDKTMSKLDFGCVPTSP